jgi:hypothetical protein
VEREALDAGLLGGVLEAAAGCVAALERLAGLGSVERVGPQDQLWK